MWLGLIIYISVVKLTQVEEYWTKNEEWPKHCIMKFQRHNRFTNIKKFFHVLPPNGHLFMSRFYEKLELIVSTIRIRFQTVAIPVTMVSINKIMIQCTGQNKHIIMIRGKLYPVGYNILALYKAGYCFNFIFSSPITGFFKLLNSTKLSNHFYMSKSWLDK